MEPTDNARSFGTDTLWVVVPKAANIAATLFLHLYAIRHLDPTTYGAFGLCLTGLAIFESLVGSALDFGLLREVPLLRGDKALGLSSLERSAIVLKLGVGIVALAIAVLCGDWLNALVLHQRNGNSSVVALVSAVHRPFTRALCPGALPGVAPVSAFWRRRFGAYVAPDDARLRFTLRWLCLSNFSNGGIRRGVVRGCGRLRRATP